MPASCALDEPSRQFSLKKSHYCDVIPGRVKNAENGALPRVESESSELKQLILTNLRKSGTKEVPFRFLYDKKGSNLYEAITQLEEYYPFNAEDELLKEHAEDIASHIPEGSIVVELGCGSAKKTARLLNALIARHGRCRFVGIDVSNSFLDVAECNLMLSVEGQLSVDLVQADYLEGLRKVRRMYPNEQLCLLWMGSAVGNFAESDAISFFKDMLESVNSQCRLFLCTDTWKKASTLYAAYHDKQGVTENFIKNGMRNALRILGHDGPSVDQDEGLWVYEVDTNEELRQVEMYIRFPQGLNLSQHFVNIRPGERVLMEISRKMMPEDIHYMAEESGFHLLSAWRNEKYGAQMLLSDVEALTECWQDSDTLFQGLPDWSVKPIEVRHPFCFYYGHLSSFMKLKLFPKEPASDLDSMFSRGIDPVVLDPTQCHDHPEIPPEWPKQEEIVAYVMSNRRKVLEALAADVKKWQPRLISFILEHERMHQETLAYMMAQERKVAFQKRIAQCENNFKCSMGPPTTMAIIQTLSRSKMINIEAGVVSLGADANRSGFLWDNEYPPLRVTIPSAFFVSSQPVSIGQFYRFVLEEGYDKQSLWANEDFDFMKKRGMKFPATWSRVGEEIFVHEFQATHHWSKVADQPVFVSLSEAEAFCRWTGCRIMTEAEYQRILDADREDEIKTTQQIRTGGWEWTSSPFEPFPGFKAMAEYPEYSTDFFDGRHFVLKGSSPVTHPSMRRDSFRNYYQRQYPYVFAKFRCCR